MFLKRKRLLRRLSNGDSAFKRTIAGDVNTPVKVLDMLAHETPSEIRFEVAGNPSTSKETLYDLSHDEAKSVRGAALTRLLELSGESGGSRSIWETTSSPRLVASIAEDLGFRERENLVYFHEQNPEVLTELAKARNISVRAEVASTEAAAPAILTSLAADADESIRLTVAGNTSTPSWTLTNLLLGDPSDEVRTKVLDNRSVPTQALMAVAAHGSADVRQHAASVAAATAEVLSRLAQDESPGVRRAVASNPNTSDEILNELAADPDPEVRLAIASGKKVDVYFGTFTGSTLYARTPPLKALLGFAADAAPGVRMAAASQPGLPVDIFIKLADDPHAGVRAHVATVIEYGYGDRSEDRWGSKKSENDFPVAALPMLAESSHLNIRMAVAKHPRVPAEQLARLLDDEHVFDQERDVHLSDKVMPHITLSQRSWSLEEWRALAQVSNPLARRVVAYSWGGVPEEVLALLARDDVEYVRQAVLENGRLTAATLRILVDDPSPSVADKASSLLEKHTSRFQDNLGVFVDSNNARARATLARDATATQEWLASLALDPTTVVRVAVAGNRNTPPRAFASLSADSDPDVVQAVADAVRRGVASPSALDAVAMSPHTKIRVAVAAMSGLSPETLRLLVQDSEESVRLAAARNGHTSVAALIAIIATDDLNKKYGIGQTSVTALCALAQDETLAVDSLHALAQSPFAEVRLSVVKNAAVSKAILANLTRDKSPQVREAVGAHCDTPKEGLMALTNDASAEVRRAVAANPATSSEALASLDRDPDGEVALAVALHPNTPPSSLDALVEVHDQPRTNEGTSLALKMLIQGKLNRLPWVHELPARLTRSDNMWHQGVRQAVASNPLASPNSLETLSQQPDTVAFVAGNLSTPAATLSRLVRHEDKLVREALASNPNLSEAELAILSLDQHDAVRKCVADNPRTAIHTLEILANDFSPENKVVARSALLARTPVADR